MILYQMAKWMEERAQLNDSISLAGGEADELLSQRARLQEMMLSQANQWLTQTVSAPMTTDYVQEPAYQEFIY
ncbi:hypothetical protein [Paenibacillus hamazuiensis]|uniref:hypothetical protein n=1 Tax=Paenibacillus hamazuiensis TaxID=2936508 RepID=UPI00200CE406|nr:hypothetical protein [Paenibacillus hamazuiensis]